MPRMIPVTRDGRIASSGNELKRSSASCSSLVIGGTFQKLDSVPNNSTGEKGCRITQLSDLGMILLTNHEPPQMSLMAASVKRTLALCFSASRTIDAAEALSVAVL